MAAILVCVVLCVLGEHSLRLRHRSVHSNLSSSDLCALRVEHDFQECRSVCIPGTQRFLHDAVLMHRKIESECHKDRGIVDCGDGDFVSHFLHLDSQGISNDGKIGN